MDSDAMRAQEIVSGRIEGTGQVLVEDDPDLSPHAPRRRPCPPQPVGSLSSYIVMSSVCRAEVIRL